MTESLHAAVDSSVKLTPAAAAAAAADDDHNEDDALDCCDDVTANTISNVKRIANIRNWRSTKYTPSRQNRADLNAWTQRTSSQSAGKLSSVDAKKNWRIAEPFLKTAKNPARKRRRCAEDQLAYNHGILVA